MANALTLLVRMQADVRQMEYALSSVERRMGGLEGKLAGTGRTMSATGRAMTIGLTAPVLAVGGAALKAATDWETAFTGVRKTINDTDFTLAKNVRNFQDLEKQLRGLALEIPIEGGQVALAGIAEMGGALGVPVDDIVEFTRVVAIMGATTNLTIDDAATSFGNLRTTLGLAGDDFMNLADVVVHLGNNGASTEAQIVNMMKAMAGGAAIIKMNTEDVAAWAAALANTGEKTEAGASSFQKFFLGMFKHVNAGGEELEKFAEITGRTTESIQADWAAGGTRMNDTLVDLMTSMSKLSEAEQLAVLELFGFNDIRITRAMLRLLSNTENITDMMNLADNAADQATVEFEKRVETLASQLQLVGQQFYEIGITIGEALIPIIKDDVIPLLHEGADIIQEWADKFKALDEDTRRNTLIIAGLVAAAGPLLFIFGGVLQFVGGIVGLLNGAKGMLMGLFGLAGSLGRLAGGGTGRVAQAFAQPVFVTNWPPGFGTGTGGPAGAIGNLAKGGFWGNFWKGVGRTIGIAFVAYAGVELGRAIGNMLIEETVKPARDYFNDAADKVVAEGSREDVVRALEEVNRNLDLGANFWDAQHFGALILDAGGLRTTLEMQRDALEAQLAVLDEQEQGARARGGQFETPRDVGGIWEERFGGRLDKLATNEVIEHLARTTEMGLKGVGTSIEVGITTGMDPVGDIATRILARAEDPKAPAVMNEIQGHLLGLEEIQQTYLDRGDINLANKVQENIDILNDLLGTEDEHRAVTEAMAAAAASSDAAMLATAQQQTGLSAEQKAAIHTLNASEGTRFANLGSRVSAVESAVNRVNSTIASKNFTPVIYNNNIVTAPTGAPITYAEKGGKQIGPPRYASGAWEILGNQLAFLHSGEMVVPEKQAESWRRGLKSGGESGGPQTYEEHLHLEVDGLMQVARPSDLIRPMKHLARGRRMTRPRYGFSNG